MIQIQSDAASIVEGKLHRGNEPKQFVYLHGGDICGAAEKSGRNEAEFLDFSANINPLGMPPGVREAIIESLDRSLNYPDPFCRGLKAALSEKLGQPEDYILCGNGGADLIYRLVYATRPKRALVTAPTFAEYEEALNQAGTGIDFFPLGKTLEITEAYVDSLSAEHDMVFLCNPNNPTSTATTPDDMRQILECCRKHHIFLMVDETYAEFAPEDTSVSSVGLLQEFDNFAILRGISKFFAAPGLRLGYAMTSDLELLKNIKEQMNPWSINSLAELAGSYMFNDWDYIRRTRDLISSERERIYQELLTWKTVKVYKPYANFILVKILKEGVTSYDVFVHAIKKGLMLRDCSTFLGMEDETFFRFCFMMPDKNTELLACLKELLG